MRTINTSEITKNIKEMCMQVNVKLSDDVKEALLAGKEKEESQIGIQILPGKIRYQSARIPE